MRRIGVVAFVFGLMAAAAPAAAVAEGADRVPGMVITESTRSFDDTWDALIGALDANPAIGIVAIIDHGAAAASVGFDLPPNRVVVFGNPALGTPLMLEHRSVGLDLPQKMAVWEENGRVYVGYNSVEYLAARHDVGAAATLPIIAGALQGLAATATGAEVDDTSVPPIPRRTGLTTVQSGQDFDATVTALQAAIEASPASLVFAVDHDANAAGAGFELPATQLTVFGNPVIGTPLMQSAPSAGIDLPLEILVWEDAGGDVRITYGTAWSVAARHGIRAQQTLTSVIDTVLAGLAAAASGA